MSDSDRPERTSFIEWIIPAMYIAGFLIIAGMIFLNVAGHKTSPEQQYYSSECGKADEQYRILVDDTLPRALHAEENTKAGKREKKAREQVAHWCDLLAQQASAEATVFAAKQSLWTNIFAAGVFFLTFAGVWLLLGTLTHTKAAAIAAKTAAESGADMVTQSEGATKASEAAVKETRRIGEAQVRAYLTVERVESWYDGQNYSAKIKIKNSGSTPAKRIDIHVDYVHANGDTTTEIESIKPLASQENFTATISWCDSEACQPETVTTGDARVDRIIRSSAPSRRPVVNEFVGEIRYDDVFSATRKVGRRNKFPFKYVGGPGLMEPDHT